VSVITGAGLKEIKEGTAVYTKNGEEDTLDGDAILLATGRGPNTEGLHAERAGVELTKRGAVVTDKHLRTTAENIWAAGDVCGNLQFRKSSDPSGSQSSAVHNKEKTIAQEVVYFC
jgi:pyruvate/2-oxoglutarate dehydrogenase complex dihydrolipoamide dehydrogenase (E3) component